MANSVIGLGDSFMAGYNASDYNVPNPTISIYPFFNSMAIRKKFSFKNMGVAGQAICSGGTQPGFNLANIPTKTSYDKYLIVDWGLNDAYNVYFDASRTIGQVQTAIGDFFTSGNLTGAGWVASDVIWITGWNIGSNIYYTQAQFNNIRDYIISTCISNGAKYITNMPTYPLDVDNIHPKNNGAYSIIANYVYQNIK
jgi:hypothetical protein